MERSVLNHNQNIVDMIVCKQTKAIQIGSSSRDTIFDTIFYTYFYPLDLINCECDLAIDMAMILFSNKKIYEFI